VRLIEAPRRRASDRGTRTRASLLSRRPSKQKMEANSKELADATTVNTATSTVNTDAAVSPVQGSKPTYTDNSAHVLESSVSGRGSYTSNGSSLRRSDQQSVVPSMPSLHNDEDNSKEQRPPFERKPIDRNQSLSITRSSPKRNLLSEMSLADIQISDHESFVEDSAVEVDYYRNPTLLSRLIQFQKYENALHHLEEHPDEASTWLVAKQQQQRRRRSKGLDETVDDDCGVASHSVVTTLRQLPLHMACQSFSLLQSHDPNNFIYVLEELLTQLLVVYPKGCQYPDHNGMYAIHYMIQYRAPPELISLALIMFPQSANSLTIRDPFGRSLQELFQSTAATAPGGDRAQKRQEQQIEELLEFDTAFWEQTRKESKYLRGIQKSWNAETKRTKKSKFGTSSEAIANDLRPPWQLANERESRRNIFHPHTLSEETERTVDETQTTDDDDLAGEVAEILSEHASEGVSPTAWRFLEQRALTLEQLVMESNSRNYELQQCLNVVAEERDSNVNSTITLVESGLKMTELARQAYELRKENEKLKSELRVAQVRLGRERENSLKNVFRRGSNSSRVSALAKAVESSLMSSATTINSEAILSGSNESKGNTSERNVPPSESAAEKPKALTETNGNSMTPRRPSPPKRRSSRKLGKAKKKEKSERKLNAKTKKAPERALKTDVSEAELKQREVNRKIHEEYHSLVQRHREQEENLKRLEKTVDVLLENTSRVDPKKKKNKSSRRLRSGGADMDEERRKALSWLPSWMNMPETDNLSVIFSQVCDQEDELRRQDKIDIHRRLQAKPTNPLPKPPGKSADASFFHFDIELPFLGNDNRTDECSGPSTLDRVEGTISDHEQEAINVSCHPKPRTLIPVKEVVLSPNQGGER